MGSRTPIVRQTSWPLVVPQLAVLALAIGIASIFVQPFHLAAMWGAGACLLYASLSRLLILRHHRRGMALLLAGRFHEAIDAFESSYRFFARRPWLDRYRAITLMMPSAACYREMALVNIAYCFVQLGDGRRAKECYQVALAEFPDSGIATAALRMIESVETSSRTAESDARAGS
jgi:tetratricopeptide (TPR) repeat protein